MSVRVVNRSRDSRKSTKEKLIIDPYTKPRNVVIRAFLIDFETTSIWEHNIERPGVNLYYYTDDGVPVKCFYPYDPYFYIDCEDKFKTSEKAFNILRRRIKQISPEHIKKVGLVQIYDSTHPLHRFLEPSKIIKITVDSPRRVKGSQISLREEVLRVNGVVGSWREGDIQFDMRVSIDAGELIKVGRHYRVIIKSGIAVKISSDPVNKFPDVPCCVFDIETTKDPMKSPNPLRNPIATIGVLFDNDGYIICNDEVINDVPNKFIMGTTFIEGKKVLEWEYASINEVKFKEDHDDCIVVYPISMPDEYTMIHTFFEMLVKYKALAIAGYNSDWFDWSYIAKRLKTFGGDITKFGFKYNEFMNVYYIPGIMCLDAYLYVNQHSRLPEGERSLKKATKKIFKFDPIEWGNAEALMRAMDIENSEYDPHTVVVYNGSDIYCTMLFLKKVMIPYFLAMTRDKPMQITEISRKGFSIIAEAGLLQRAKKMNILAPNRAGKRLGRGDITVIKGKEYFVESESYIGAKVELTAPGLYRTDWEVPITINPTKLDEVMLDVSSAVELIAKDFESRGIKILNKEEVVKKAQDQINKIKLNSLIQDDKIVYKGAVVIIHCDVSSLYPSIVINYKLQPFSVVNEKDCSVCELREDDPPCWFTTKWVKKMEVVDADEKDKIIAKKLHEQSENKDVEEQRRKLKIRSNASFIEVLEKVVASNKRKFKKTFKIDVPVRFCQKAHDFIWKEIEDVRSDRYFYKYKAMGFYEKSEDDNIKNYMQSLIDKYNKIKKVPIDESGKVDEKKLIDTISDTEYTELQKMKQNIKFYKENAVFNDFIQEGLKAGLNSYYGYFATPAVRWQSLPEAGSITIEGRKVLMGGIDYCISFSDLIEADTDGFYNLIPEIFPIFVGAQVEKSDGTVVEEKINILAGLLNLYCLRNFSNINNYENINNEWVHSPKCNLKFDIDGPYDIMYIQAAKKYALWKNGKLKILKGLETKRNNALILEREIIEDVFNIYKAENLQSLEDAYRQAEKYIRNIVDKLRKKQTELSKLTKNTNISTICVRRLKNAGNVLDMLREKGITDFAFSFHDMQLVKIAKKRAAGNISTYKARMIINSMDRSMSEPYFNMSLTELQLIIDAYEDKTYGINQGPQFMAAFRDQDIGSEMNEYSSVMFIKIKYPSGKFYEMNNKGRIVSKEISGAVSDGSIPYNLFDTSVDTINSYVKKWTGNDPELVSKDDIAKMVDFDYYISYIKSLTDRLIVFPAGAQGIHIHMGDAFDEKLSKFKSITTYLQPQEVLKDDSKLSSAVIIDNIKIEAQDKDKKRKKSKVSITDFLV